VASRFFYIYPYLLIHAGQFLPALTLITSIQSCNALEKVRQPSTQPTLHHLFFPNRNFTQTNPLRGHLPTGSSSPITHNHSTSPAISPPTNLTPNAAYHPTSTLSTLSALSTKRLTHLLLVTNTFPTRRSRSTTHPPTCTIKGETRSRPPNPANLSFRNPSPSPSQNSKKYLSSQVTNKYTKEESHPRPKTRNNKHSPPLKKLQFSHHTNLIRAVNPSPSIPPCRSIPLRLTTTYHFPPLLSGVGNEMRQQNQTVGLREKGRMKDYWMIGVRRKRFASLKEM
jgi:hypothetical protein